MISKELLQRQAEKHQIALDATALERFDQYAQLLVKWNTKINLTAITQPDEIVWKHFIDSLILLNIGIKEEAKLMDVGTGAGFPGLALLIARPDLQVTLLDSTKKKLMVIEDIISKLDLKANIVHARAEEAGRDPMYREQFDLVTARAVRNLRELCEYGLPFAKVGGVFAPLKGAGADEELKDAQKAIVSLGGEFCRIENLFLDGCGERAIVVIKKLSQTSLKYPRPSAQIAKNPL